GTDEHGRQAGLVAAGLDELRHAGGDLRLHRLGQLLAVQPRRRHAVLAIRFTFRAVAAAKRQRTVQLTTIPRRSARRASTCPDGPERPTAPPAVAPVRTRFTSITAAPTVRAMSTRLAAG